MTKMFDFDAHGDLDWAADAFSNYLGFVHPTYKSTREHARCRVGILLADVCTSADEIHRGQGLMRKLLVATGWYAPEDFDPKAGFDVERLYYWPMHQHADSDRRFIILNGRPLDLRKLLATSAQERPTEIHEHREGGDKSGAVRHAIAIMRRTSVGARNDTLSSLSFWLGKIGCCVEDVEDALVDAVPGDDQNEKKDRNTIRRGIRDGRRRGGHST